jgi:hypothetical protein
MKWSKRLGKTIYAEYVAKGALAENRLGISGSK